MTDLLIRACIPGMKHVELRVKGDQGTHSPGTVCPACGCDLYMFSKAQPAASVAARLKEDKIRQSNKNFATMARKSTKEIIAGVGERLKPPVRKTGVPNGFPGSNPGPDTK